MNIDELIALFLQQKEMNDGSTARTIQAYSDILERLCSFAAEIDVSPLDLSPDQLLLFAGPWLHKQGVRARSRTPYVAAVRGFFKWLLSRKAIDHNPADTVPYPKSGRKLPNVMTLDNYQRLMWAPDFGTFEGVRDAAMLSVLGGCGLRVSGLVGLNVSNLHQMEVNGARRLAIKPSEKGDHERIIPVPQDADMLLRLYLEHPDLEKIDRQLDTGDQVLFVSTGNKRCPAWEYVGENRRLSTRGVRAILKRYGDKAGIPRNQCNPHALRHLYGTEFAESDVDLSIRQKLLGHADPKTSAIYDHVALRKLTTTVDAANPLSKISTPVSALLRQLEEPNARSRHK